MAISGVESLGVRLGTLGASGRGVLAVSGGADSVALAVSLASGWPSGVVIAHLNHRLRGIESDADAEFVRQLLPDLPHFIDSVDVAQVSRSSGENLEACARRLRYAYLCRVARETSASWIATGHTLNDQAETVLHRLIRGTGLRGLRGIAESQALDPGLQLVRPMLTLMRSDVIAYLQARGQTWREDASNRDPRFTRNRIRHELLPMLQGFNPQVISTLYRLSQEAGELFAERETHARSALAAAERPRAGDWVILASPALQGQPPEIVREMLVHLFEREGWSRGEMTREHWQRAVEIALGSSRGGDFPGGTRIEYQSGTCRLRGVTRGECEPPLPDTAGH